MTNSPWVTFFLSGLMLSPAAALAADPPVPSSNVSAAPTPVEKTLRAYRSGPFAETIQLKVKDAAGVERRSTVFLRMDAGDAAANRPRRALIELGQLSLFLEGNRLIAVPKSESTRFAELTLPPRPLQSALAEVMPALLLPEFALSDPGNEDFGDLGLSAPPVSVVWEPAVVERVTGKYVFNGVGGDAKWRVVADRGTGRIVTVQVNYSSGPLRTLDLSIRTTDPGSPESWAIPVDGRTKVGSLSDLGSASITPRVGEPFPFGLSIFESGLNLWDVRSLAGPSALVFVKLDTSGLADSNVEIRDSAYNAARRSASAAVAIVKALSRGADGRWLARPVAVIDAADLRVGVTSSLFAILNSSGSSVHANSTSDPLFIARDAMGFDTLFGGGNTAIVLMDKSRLIREIITVSDPAEAESKARKVLEGLQ